jgi:glycosyltransferase involved in cell wall biosynthesis
MPGSERPPKGWSGWPEDKKFALVLTHDVESERGLNKCRQLMQLEMELGFRSSFNFVPEGGYRVSQQLREELGQNGFEVGVHDFKHDGRLFASRGEFERNTAPINEYIKNWGAAGFRSGFMLHNLHWLHDLDIQYDASTFDTDPFEPQPDGRNTIFPFWVPRAVTQSANGYVELPYTLPQDFTLFVLLRETTIDIWRRKLDWIAEHGGMALLIAHPDYMSFNGGPIKPREFDVSLYREFLRYVDQRYGRSCWKALPRQVAAHVTETRKQQGSEVGQSLRFRGKRAAVLLFSHYPADPRPRRAAEALVREGVSIDLICLQENEDEQKRETVDGVNVSRVPLKRRRGGRITYIAQYATFILISFFYLAFRSLTRRYDFVHVHNMPDVLVFSALVPRLLGAKIILDLHDPMPELMRTIFKLPEEGFSVRLLKRLEKWSIAFADAVLTVNLACKKIYTSRSCAAEKIHVVLNSPEDDVFAFQPATSQGRNGAQTSKPFEILYHGSLVERNGFDLAVNALEIIKGVVPQARLRVCGAATPFFDKVMTSAEQRGLQKLIDYAGVMDRKQIAKAIHNCDLGIIPNHRNIFTEINTPTRIFEYLALGRPVIAPRAGGIQDYFNDEELIFFNLGDAKDLAEKIEFVFTRPGEVDEIVKRGQKVYLSHTWSQEKSRLLSAISELV